MQNKGLIAFFAILFGLVSIYQLSYTYLTNKTESAAEAYADRVVDANAVNAASLKDDAVKQYLDSVSGEELWYTTYSDAKNEELQKGLDLKGGINVILQISVKDLLIGMADGSKNADFRAALDRADERVKDGQDSYFEYFYDEFTKIEGAELTDPEIFANQQMDGVIDIDMNNEQAKGKLEVKLQEYMVSAFEVLRKRIDKFGVTQPNIQRLGDSGRILIELPGAKDIKRVESLLTSTAQLEFWHVFRGQDIGAYLQQADTYWAQQLAAKNESASTDQEPTAPTEDAATASQEGTEDITDILENETADKAAEEEGKDQVIGNDENPIFSRMLAAGDGRLPVLATFRASDKKLITDYLNDAQLRSKLQGEQRYAKFAWGLPVLNEELGYEIVDLYAIKSNREDEAPLSGGVITSAKQDFDMQGRVIVSMQKDAEGAKIWEDMTTQAYQNQTQIAVVLDNTVYSAPGINNGPIAGGNSQISGNFTVNEAEDLANVLRAGKLPASAEIIQKAIVGPSLGKEAIKSGLYSFGIALILVLVWMVFYYGRAGLYADIALLVNILFIFGALASLKAVLTLPGIAGIVLTIGISVDANVLIFERIREELAKGKSQADSIKDGFNNALSSIIDANVTTFLTALILFVFGTGPIQGFATTLMIGIATSLFTAIFITRLFIDGYGKNGKELAFSTPITKNWFRNVNIDFLGKRKMAYIGSLVLALVCVGSLVTKGLNLGIDFSGGRTYTVRFEKPIDAVEVTNLLSAENVLGSAEAKTYGDANQLKISTKYGIDGVDSLVSKEIESKLYTNLKQYMPDGMSQADFADISKTDKVSGIMSNFQVGPTIADDILTGSLYAIFGSLIVVFIYILIRFRKWQFSLGAVVAVFHDVLIVLGLFSLTHDFLPFNMEIDQAFIAAILTVIGYSLNDTVVVFDRIREFINERTNWDFPKTVNAAISSTISRTLNTSLTTLIVLLAIFTFGGESIQGFMLALIIGVLVGTYSSVFIATPVMYDTMEKSKGKIEPKAIKEEKED